MKLRNLGTLVRISPIAMTVFGIFYPPILFAWVGLSALVAAIVIYPNELADAIHYVLVSVGPWSNEVVAAVLQNSRPLAFFAVMVLAMAVIGPVILFGLIWWSDDAVDSLFESWEDSAE